MLQCTTLFGGQLGATNLCTVSDVSDLTRSEDSSSSTTAILLLLLLFFNPPVCELQTDGKDFLIKKSAAVARSRLVDANISKHADTIKPLLICCQYS